MKVSRSSPVFVSAHFLALIKEGPRRAESYRSLSRLLAGVSYAPAMYFASDTQDSGQETDRAGGAATPGGDAFLQGQGEAEAATG